MPGPSRPIPTGNCVCHQGRARGPGQGHGASPSAPRRGGTKLSGPPGRVLGIPPAVGAGGRSTPKMCTSSQRQTRGFGGRREESRDAASSAPSGWAGKSQQNSRRESPVGPVSLRTNVFPLREVGKGPRGRCGGGSRGLLGPVAAGGQPPRGSSGAGSVMRGVQLIPALNGGLCSPPATWPCLYLTQKDCLSWQGQGKVQQRKSRLCRGVPASTAGSRPPPWGPGLPGGFFPACSFPPFRRGVCSKQRSECPGSPSNPQRCHGKRAPPPARPGFVSSSSRAAGPFFPAARSNRKGSARQAQR